MAQKEEQIIRLSEDDRELLEKLVKWIRFFPVMYLVLWIVMCLAIITSMWLIWGSR